MNNPNNSATALPDNIAEFQKLITEYNDKVLKKQHDIMMEVEIRIALKDFNAKQKTAELYGEKIKSFEEMIDFYANHTTCIQAECKRASFPSYSYFATYKNANIKFSDLCKHCNCDINYNTLEALFSTVCYNIFENMRNDETIFGIPLLNKNNPYKSYNIPSITGKRLTPSDLKSKTAIKNILITGLSKIFKSEAYVFSKTIRHLLMLVASRASVRQIVDSYFLMHISIRYNIEISEGSPRSNKISRHISWCVYESDRFCSLLKQPCNSSINCALYRGVTYKG